MTSIILTHEEKFLYPITRNFKVSKYRMQKVLSTLVQGDWELNKPFLFFGTGTSGAMCLVLIQTILPDSKVCLLNTTGSVHRSDHEFSGNVVGLSELSNYTTVFVDDLVATGRTLNRCKSALNISKFDIVATLFQSSVVERHEGACDTFITFERYNALSNP